MSTAWVQHVQCRYYNTLWTRWNFNKNSIKCSPHTPTQDTTGDAETHKILLRRANELVNVLKVPSIASAVLSPPAHSGGGMEMQRQTNLAYLLQSTANYLQT